MLSLILAFAEIALHRRGPEHLPASRFLLAAVLVAYLAVALVAANVAGDSAYPTSALLIQLVLELAFIWCVLRAFERQRRFMQAATATIGVDTILNVISIPLLAWHRALPQETADAAATLPQVLQFLLLVWSIDISTSIMARALDRPYVVALGIVIGYTMLSMALHFTLYPPTTP